ncbi:MAG: hypothetical protein AAF713_02515 [Pseudomonadota bacterium]
MLSGWKAVEQKNRFAAGKCKFVTILRLLETFPLCAVHAAVKDALRLGATSADCARHPVLARIEGRSVRLDADCYPQFPAMSFGRASRTGGVAGLAL